MYVSCCDINLICTPGVPAIPPYYLGYRHFSKTPLYFAQGLDNIPTTKSEYTMFSLGPYDPNNSRKQFLRISSGRS